MTLWILFQITVFRMTSAFELTTKILRLGFFTILWCSGMVSFIGMLRSPCLSESPFRSSIIFGRCCFVVMSCMIFFRCRIFRVRAAIHGNDGRQGRLLFRSGDGCCRLRLRRRWLTLAHVAGVLPTTSSLQETPQTHPERRVEHSSSSRRKRANDEEKVRSVSWCDRIQTRCQRLISHSNSLNEVYVLSIFVGTSTRNQRFNHVGL